MNDLSFTILKIVVSVATALISIYVIPLLREKLKDAKYQKLVKIVKVAVDAAEQTIKGSGMGAIKKDDVIAFVTWYAAVHGINISDEHLDKLIECVVFNMNGGKNGNGGTNSDIH